MAVLFTSRLPDQAYGAVVDALADAGLDDLDDGADERARGVVFAAVASGVAPPKQAAKRRSNLAQGERSGTLGSAIGDNQP